MKLFICDNPCEKPAFKPITISMTIESQEELNALYCIGGWNASMADLAIEKARKSTTKGLDTLTRQVALETYHKFYLLLNSKTA